MANVTARLLGVSQSHSTACAVRRSNYIGLSTCLPHCVVPVSLLSLASVYSPY